MSPTAMRFGLQHLPEKRRLRRHALQLRPRSVRLRPGEGQRASRRVLRRGSWEYHTYADTMERFNEESLGVSVTIYGTYMRFLAYSDY